MKKCWFWAGNLFKTKLFFFVAKKQSWQCLINTMVLFSVYSVHITATVLHVCDSSVPLPDGVVSCIDCKVILGNCYVTLGHINKMNWTRLEKKERNISRLVCF